MSRPTIYLAFTDDWELRGDGSGDIRELQFGPMKRLREIFEKHGARCTFMAEVMQQITFRHLQSRFTELGPLADEWDAHVYDAFRRGHDVQLHLHTQWSDPEYREGKWKLKGDWSILNYNRAEAADMIVPGKQYLETLLKPIDAGYSPIAFRASYLAIAPSPFLLGVLAESGIELDVSLVGGLKVNTAKVRIDYTDCGEDFAPFYPNMADARRVSESREPIVCLPIFHFTGSRRNVARQIGLKVKAKLADRFSPREDANPGRLTAVNEAALELGRSSAAAKIVDKIVRPIALGKHVTADVGQMTLPLLREMLAHIRRRARLSGIEEVPVVLTNHTKNMRDYDVLDHFLGEIKRAEDVRIVTLREVAKGLKSGKFAIRRESRPRTQ